MQQSVGTVAALSRSCSQLLHACSGGLKRPAWGQKSTTRCIQYKGATDEASLLCPSSWPCSPHTPSTIPSSPAAPKLRSSSGGACRYVPAWPNHCARSANMACCTGCYTCRSLLRTTALRPKLRNLVLIPMHSTLHTHQTTTTARTTSNPHLQPLHHSTGTPRTPPLPVHVCCLRPEAHVRSDLPYHILPHRPSQPLPLLRTNYSLPLTTPRLLLLIPPTPPYAHMLMLMTPPSPTPPTVPSSHLFASPTSALCPTPTPPGLTSPPATPHCPAAHRPRLFLHLLAAPSPPLLPPVPPPSPQPRGSRRAPQTMQHNGALHRSTSSLPIAVLKSPHPSTLTAPPATPHCPAAQAASRSPHPPSPPTPAAPSPHLPGRPYRLPPRCHVALVNEPPLSAPLPTPVPRFPISSHLASPPRQPRPTTQRHRQLAQQRHTVPAHPSHPQQRPRPFSCRPHRLPPCCHVALVRLRRQHHRAGGQAQLGSGQVAGL